MKRFMKLLTATVALMALTAPALADVCAPLPPKDLQGSISFVGAVRTSAAAAYFQQNACSWNGNDQLNGTDAFVFDATGIEGQASVSITAGTVGFQIAFEGIVLDANCKPIGDKLSIGSSTADYPVPYLIQVPAGAKWLIIEGNSANPVSTNISTQSTIAIHYEGKACEAAPPIKKKKKKKKH